LQNDGNEFYVIVFNSPVETGTISQNWFCNLFTLECGETDVKVFKANVTYTSKNINNIIKPLSVIECHCNIAEYTYSNHDYHPHLHKHDELLHNSFIDKVFYEDFVYKEISKTIIFIPLRERLREIKEIILTPLDEKNKEIQILKYVTVYLN
jgi:hypothetical protein